MCVVVVAAAAVVFDSYADGHPAAISRTPQRPLSGTEWTSMIIKITIVEPITIINSLERQAEEQQWAGSSYW